MAKERSYAVDLRGLVRAYREPGGRAFARFGLLNINGVPTVFAALDAVIGARCRAAWYRVQLPIKPNGVTGYVRARDVRLRVVRSRVVVDLSARRVALYHRGRLALVTTSAIGAWAQGGPVANHGTNRPSLLGLRVSNGCIRVSNPAIRRIWRLAPTGTPVLVRA